MLKPEKKSGRACDKEVRGQGHSSKQTALWMLKYDVWLLCMSECCTDLFTYAKLTHIYQRMLIFVWSL